MTIELGVYALYRADGSENSAMVLHDEPTGLRVSVGPVGADKDLKAPYVAMIADGSVEVDGLGTINQGEALVGHAAADVTPPGSGATWVTIECLGTDGPDTAIALRPDEHPDLPDCPPPAAENLLSDTPTQHDLTIYSDSKRDFGAGFWDSTPFRRRTIPFPKFEVIHILTGWLELTFEDGRVDLYKPGDTFLIVKGTRFEWRTEGLSKIWCSFAPEN